MSKQWNDEYKQHIQMEAPDLWDRIEKGIDAKMAQQTVNSQQADTSRVETAESSKIVSIKKRNFKALYGTLTAAAVLLVVCIPVMRYAGSAQETSRADSAPAENMQEAGAVEDIQQDDGAASEQEAGNIENSIIMEEEEHFLTEDKTEELGETSNTTSEPMGTLDSDTTGGAGTVEQRLTILGVEMQEDGSVLYTAQADDGEQFTIFLSEDVWLNEENNISLPLTVGEKYGFELELNAETEEWIAYKIF